MALNTDRRTSTAGAGSPGRQPRVDVIIVTTDDDLLIELGPVFDENYRSRPLEKVPELAELLQGRRCVVVLDAGGSVDTRAAYAQLSAHHPEVPVLVIATAGSRVAWEAALQRGAIKALLKRDDELRTKFATALRSATLHSAQLPAANSSAASTGTAPVVVPAGSGLKPMMMVGAGVVVLLLAAALWWWLRDNGSGTAGAGVAATTHATTSARNAAGKPAAETPTMSVAQLMSAARVAFSEQHYLEPAGSSALDDFTRVLQIEPKNDEARDGVVRLFGIIRSRTDLAIKAGHVDEAETLLAAVRAASPDSDLAKDLGRSVAAEKPRWLANQFRAQLAAGDLPGATQSLADLDSISADKKVVQDLQRQLETRQRDSAAEAEAGSIRALIAADALLDPANSNAQTALTALPAADRRSGALLAVQRELQLALIARSRDAVRDARLDVAERYLDAATELGGAPDLTEARQQLNAAQEEAARTAAANRAAASAAAQAAVADNAARTAPQYVQVKVRRSAEAVYPPKARDARVEGFVDVKFNISPSGKAYNVGVLQSSAPGVFDSAALASVERTQFEPVASEPGAEAPLGRLRISFKLQ